MNILKAELPVYGGFVLGRNGGVVFIKGAVPGEVVEVEIIEKRKDYSLAQVINVIEPSEFRVEPRCSYFGECGGCTLQHIAYERQVTMKEEILIDCLRRIGGIETEIAPSIYKDPFHYRHRAQFKVSKDGLVGFFKEGTRDVVAISSCPIMKEPINEALSRLRAFNLSGIKEIHITYGDSLIARIRGKGFDEKLVSEFLGMGFSGVAFEDHSYSGKGYVSLPLEVPQRRPLTYTVSPWAFFQSNWTLNNIAAGYISEWLSSLEGKTLVYLYAGAGNFALPLSETAKEIIAIEENPDSVKDGKRNIEINKIKNFKFIAQSAEKSIPKGDVFVLDPPRPGLSDRVVRSILEASPERIVYVSCNPSTLARDLKKFSEKYSIDSIRCMDFFPNTYHIEALTFLSKNN